MVTTISRLRQKLQQNERAINGRIVRIRNKGYSFEWLS
jgi:DNA-binding response OmpR family regulator